MPLCPNCNTEQRVRKNDSCPNCGEEVTPYHGTWIRTAIGSPTYHILTRFEEFISKKYSTPTRKVVWTVPRKSATYIRELSLAEQFMNKCGYDLEFADIVLDEMFSNEKFAWKNRESLSSVLRDLSLVSAIARAKMKEAEETKAKRNKALDAIMDKEDIFS